MKRPVRSRRNPKKPESKKGFSVVLDFVARRYKVRPSVLIGMDVERIPAVALSYDIEVAMAGAAAEAEAMERAGGGGDNRETVLHDAEAILNSLPPGSIARLKYEEMRKANGGRDK